MISFGVTPSKEAAIYPLTQLVKTCSSKNDYPLRI